MSATLVIRLAENILALFEEAGATLTERYGALDVAKTLLGVEPLETDPATSSGKLPPEVC
jgi:hypothetical protein